MKRFLLLLGMLSFCLSSCSPGSGTNHTPSSNASNALSGIDQLIAQHDGDMDPGNNEHQAFKSVLQGLKDGTMGINDAFVRSGTNGGQKCQAQYKWNARNVDGKPQEWQTFLIHIVERGCTPGNHIPYFEYAKAQNANFRIWDMYGRSLLHLVLDFDTPYDESDLTWLLENTEAKDLINAKTKEEGNPAQEGDGTKPLEGTRKKALQDILRKHGAQL